MRVLTVLLLAAAAYPALAGDVRIDRLVEDLSSPFADRREGAVARLAARVDAAAPALREAYRGADFERKALILDVFARGAAREGIDLVTGDPGAEDRGVVHAQRRLVSALFLAVRGAVAEGLPMLADRDDWRSEEALRALPARAPSSRRALLSALESKVARRAEAARRVAGAVSDVDRLREALVAVRGGGDERLAEGAREMLRHLIRHETERALRAVLEAGGRSGSYDGMYGLLSELPGEDLGAVCATLVSIVTGRTPPEGGVPGGRDGGGLLETDIFDELEMAERAAACLGEIGGPAVAEELREYYERMGSRDPDRYDDTRWPIALALGALGVREPLLDLIRQYSKKLGIFGEEDGESPLRSFLTGWVHEALSSAWSRLGNFERAEHHLRASLADRDRPIVRMYNYACLLSRMGKVEESVAALRAAVEGGYALDPSNVRWMQRDGDLAGARATEDFARLLEDIHAGHFSVPR
jgi:hypothetical protein